MSTEDPMIEQMAIENAAPPPALTGMVEITRESMHELHAALLAIPGEPSETDSVACAARLLNEWPGKFRRHAGAESLIGVKIPCLDHGYVMLVDYMGSDEAIDEAARVSYMGGAREARTVEQRTNLIRYLMRHRHTTPFEMVELHFEIALPIMVWRQWIRHRMASVNEFSGRYGVLPDLYYTPDPDRLRVQSSSNKQGSGNEVVPDVEKEHDDIVFEQVKAREFYEHRLAIGMANEIARINTPISQYTVMRWKIDLHNLFHFVGLRLDGHAQSEIRVYSEAIDDVLHRVVPIARQAFRDYRLNACSFSALELIALKALVHGQQRDLAEIGMTSREQTELVTKLRQHLGLDVQVAADT